MEAGGGRCSTEAGLGTAYILLDLLPDPHLSPGHLSLPGLCTSRGISFHPGP